MKCPPSQKTNPYESSVPSLCEMLLRVLFAEGETLGLSDFT